MQGELHSESEVNLRAITAILHAALETGSTPQFSSRVAAKLMEIDEISHLVEASPQVASRVSAALVESDDDHACIRGGVLTMYAAEGELELASDLWQRVVGRSTHVASEAAYDMEGRIQDATARSLVDPVRISKWQAFFDLGPRRSL
jgi:hypothetical protein